MDMHKNDALDAGLARLGALSPEGYALGLHIRYASALLMFQTYRADWLDVYSRRGYLMCDPVVSWAIGHLGWSRWSAIDHPDPNNVMGHARDYGLTYGVQISCGPLESRSIGGFARSDREYTDAEAGEIHAIVEKLHALTEPKANLTKAQKEALRLIAKGSRYAEAAAELGISESALKARLNAAKERLMARTIAHAVQRAVEFRLI